MVGAVLCSLLLSFPVLFRTTARKQLVPMAERWEMWKENMKIPQFFYLGRWTRGESGFLIQKAAAVATSRLCNIHSSLFVSIRGVHTEQGILETLQCSI